MAWSVYYVNSGKLAAPDEKERELCILFEHRIPPHGSIRREWVTRGMKHGSARILFVEYWLEDDDIDGVWEAYGQKRESEYSFTVEAGEADPEKLFVYTLYNNGSMETGFDVDPHNARAILTFPQRQNITAGQLLALVEKAESSAGDRETLDAILRRELLGGSEETMCLAYLNR